MTIKSPFTKLEDLKQLEPLDEYQATEHHHQNQTKHVLILMSDTGGGHRAAAEAIQEGLELLYGHDISVTIVDAWQDYITWPINRIANSYGWVVNKALWIWKGLWKLEKNPHLLNLFYGLLYPLVAPGLLQLFKRYQPGVIVSVHPLLTPFSLLVLERSQLNIPFVTVVTDMIKSWHVWYNPLTTLCLVPTESIGEQAFSAGIALSKIEVVGQPVSPYMSQMMDQKEFLRSQLGFDAHRPLLLLAGGGEGYGAVFEIARTIAQHLSGVQLIVVAGRNKSLKTKLDRVDWEIPTQVFGFATNMIELMGAADIFISKAGPGSLAEAFVAGLPLIIFDYIPGQEDDNVHYVLQHNAGLYIQQPAEIVSALQDLFYSHEAHELELMAHNARHLAQPEAALTIAQRVYNLLP